MTDSLKLTVTLDETAAQQQRLDKALVHALQAQGVDLSRARVQSLMKDGLVEKAPQGLANDPSLRPCAGQTFTITLPEAKPALPQAQAIPLAIAFEDEDLLILDKPAGLVVHPAAGHWDQTLVNALLAHCGASLSGIGGIARPGIVHRLDKDTSGLMVVAKRDSAHRALSQQFSDKTLARVYQAIVWGVPTPMAGTIEGAIGRHPRARQKMAVTVRGGKPALTRYKVLETFGGLASLVSCELATGRTHQIRVHMAHIGCPVIGDPLYGRQRPVKTAAKDGQGLVHTLQSFPRQALHAVALRLRHPSTGQAMTFASPLPADMAALWRLLQKSK